MKTHLHKHSPLRWVLCALLLVGGPWPGIVTAEERASYEERQAALRDCTKIPAGATIQYLIVKNEYYSGKELHLADTLKEGTIRVNPKGYAKFPDLVEIKAEGLPLCELQAQAAALYAKRSRYCNTTLAIAFTAETNLTDADTVQVTSGGVNFPRTIRWRPGLTIMEAIRPCGGLNPYGVLRKTRLIRDKMWFVVNLEYKSAWELPLQKGDEIRVAAILM